LWGGARLRDVLMASGLPSSDDLFVRCHVCMESVEPAEEERVYGCSIPLSKAM